MLLQAGSYFFLKPCTLNSNYVLIPSQNQHAFNPYKHRVLREASTKMVL